MLYTIHPLAGTESHVIRQRDAGSATVVLVAEVVKTPGGYSVLRMDATGVLAENLPSPQSALSFYILWVRYTGPTIFGLDIDPVEAHGAGIGTMDDRSPQSSVERKFQLRRRDR